MSAHNRTTALWRKSSRSNGNGGNNCVEIAFLDTAVAVRDSKNPNAPALLFGPAEWVQWARSLPAFISLHEANPLLHRNEIAPGLPLWIRAAALLAGAAVAAMALRRGHPVEAFVIAAGAGLIGSAHAMGYEFAMFVPAVPALIGCRGWSASAIILFVMTPGFIWFGLPPFPFRFLALLLLMAASAVDGLLAARAQPELASAGPAHENDGEMVKEPCG